jgi:putative sterol carrier protein
MSRPIDNPPESVAESLDWLRRAFRPEAIGDLHATYQAELTGDSGGRFWARVDGGQLSSGEGKTPRPDVTFSMDAADFYDVLAGRGNPELLYLEDRIRVVGSLSTALKLRVLFFAERPRSAGVAVDPA